MATGRIERFRWPVSSWIRAIVEEPGEFLPAVQGISDRLGQLRRGSQRWQGVVPAGEQPIHQGPRLAFVQRAAIVERKFFRPIVEIVQQLDPRQRLGNERMARREERLIEPAARVHPAAGRNQPIGAFLHQRLISRITVGLQHATKIGQHLSRTLAAAVGLEVVIQKPMLRVARVAEQVSERRFTRLPPPGSAPAFRPPARRSSGGPHPATA